MKLNRQFRSSASGLWYTNAKSAGFIDAVKLGDSTIFKEPNESTLDFIERVAAWAYAIHKRNQSTQSKQ